jgi:hypothetical protein
MDRRDQHLHFESSKPFERVESDQPCQSDQPSDANSRAYNRATNDNARTNNCSASGDNDGKLPNNHGTSCSCPLCREFIEYTSYTASVRTEGQGTSSWIRFSDEFRDSKQSDTAAARTDIEYLTGIPTGTAI